MKKTWNALLLGAACACAPALSLAAPMSGGDPGFWTGPYAGAEVGLNNSSADSTDSSLSFTASPHVGYNVAIPFSGTYSPLILGADAFAEFNGESDHRPPGPGRADFGSHVYGVDVLAGLPIGAQRRLMPYAKLGFGDVNGTGDLDENDTSVRFGLGAEYELRRNWGLTAEWMHQDANHITNDNFTVGVNYHFRGY